MNKMSKFSKEIVEAINKVLPDALKTKIKEHIKLSNEVKLAEAITADGKTLSYEGEVLDVNTMVSVKDGDVLTPAEGKFEVVNPDGSKIIITCVAGVVTEKSEAEAEKVEEEPAAPAAKDPMIDMTAQMSAQKSEFESKFKSLETKLSTQSKVIEKLTADNKVLLEVMDALVTTPVKDKEVKNTKPYNEMSNHERALYNRGKI